MLRVKSLEMNGVTGVTGFSTSCIYICMSRLRLRSSHHTLRSERRETLPVFCQSFAFGGLWVLSVQNCCGSLSPNGLGGDLYGSMINNQVMSAGEFTDTELVTRSLDG